MGCRYNWGLPDRFRLQEKIRKFTSLLAIKPNFWASTAAMHLFFGSLVFLLNFRAVWAFKVNWQNDDGCYFARMIQWCGLGEMTAGICNRGYYFAPVTPMAWIPAG